MGFSLPVRPKPDFSRLQSGAASPAPADAHVMQDGEPDSQERTTEHQRECFEPSASLARSEVSSSGLQRKPFAMSMHVRPQASACESLSQDKALDEPIYLEVVWVVFSFARSA